MVLCCLFLKSVSLPSSQYVCAEYIKCSVKVAELPPFGKELLTQLTVRSLRYMSFFSFSYFPFWFRRQDFCSDCTSSWPLLTFYFELKYFLFITCINP